MPHLVEHDLGQQHVLQNQYRLGVVERVVLLKGLEEVRVGGLVVALLGVEDAGLVVDLRWGGRNEGFRVQGLEGGH